MPTDHEEVGGGGTAELSESLLRAPGCRLEGKFVYLWQHFGQSGVSLMSSSLFWTYGCYFNFSRTKRLVPPVQEFSIFAAS